MTDRLQFSETLSNDNTSSDQVEISEESELSSVSRCPRRASTVRKLPTTNATPESNDLAEIPAKKGKLVKRVEREERQWVKGDLHSHPVNQFRNWYSSIDQTPSVLLEKFLSPEVIDMLVQNTNKYAKVEKGKTSFETSPGELRLFLAILFTSGYAPLPRRRLYWEPSDDVLNVAISAAMTRNRFEELMQCIHVADNDQLPSGDRMAKVRPLFTSLNKSFVESFPRSRQLSIDESMVPYYGRHSAKQYIRGKPIRFGFKVWSMNTPQGYCIQLDPYQGAGTTDPQLGLGGSVVIKLASSLPVDNYLLYFDNYFTSLNLLQKLADKNFNATGTVRVNRIEKCPLIPVDKMKKMSRGSYDYRLDKTSGVLVTRWNDNSVVTIASNCHGIEPIGKAARWSRTEHKSVDITQPFVIGEYNKYMGGVDRMDQNVGEYRISIRSRKWWWALFAYLLDVSKQNAWIIYRNSEAAVHRPLDQLAFCRDICNVYYRIYKAERPAIGRSIGRPKRIDHRVPKHVRTDGINHILESSGTQRRCGVCGLKTRRECKKCDIGLHLECSDTFHQ